MPAGQSLDRGIQPAPQKLADEYTKLIKDYLQDARITTELVDHMPASDTVPSPLRLCASPAISPSIMYPTWAIEE